MDCMTRIIQFSYTLFAKPKFVKAFEQIIVVYNSSLTIKI